MAYRRVIAQFLQRAWRLWRSNPGLFYRRLLSFTRSPRQALGELANAPRRAERIQRSYGVWLRCPAVSQKAVPAGPGSPLLSVIMPVFNTEPAALREAIDSVQAQTYGNWELCIADDASSAPHVRELLAMCAQRDERVRVVRRDRQGHIAAASNSALAIARGEFVVLLDHDDRLAPDALAAVAEAIGLESAVDFVYTDEDKLDFDGTRIEPFFKPAWSPTLLTTGNYITHLAAMRRTLVEEVGGFRDELVGSQDHDLFLRVAERARVVAHIPRVLYSWRKSATSTATATAVKPYAVAATRAALEDAVERSGEDAYVTPARLNGAFYMRRRHAARPRVSAAVWGDARAWEVILRWRSIEVCEVVSLGTAASIEAASGDVLLFLNAAERPANEGSVLALLEQTQRRGMGVACGMTVRRRTGEVLQAGLTIGPGGQPVYAYAGLPSLPQRNFYLNLKDLPREVSAGYLGCSAVRREVWEELGSWPVHLPPQLALCDLCLRALAAGYENVYSPLARFTAAGALPPLPSVIDRDWQWRDFDDPFWNPNLTPGAPDGLPFRCGADRRPRLRPGPRARIAGPVP